MLTSTTFRITQDRPLNVIIVGGSISGLLTGLMLKRNGAHVTILEQTPHELEHQAAGIATGPPLAAFLAKFDRSARPFSLPTDGIHTVDRADRELGFTALDMRMNSWDALYYRLRWNFDGLASSYYPEEEEEEQQQQQQQQQPPLPLGEGARDGKAAYRSGCRLRGIQTGSGDSPVKVRFVHVRSGTETELAADLLIGADGANSAVRNMVLSPDERPKREYANYVLWRGVVPETAVSEKTRVLLEGKLSFLLLNRQYAIA
ncbi:MAG: hypothetical protein LQ340_000313 [Diploschistes diacapsis]|nr:MAG: hypothetical protein LQ340_000313 [Diploschistes diacapsis]